MYYLNAWFKYSLLQKSFIAVVPLENKILKISKQTLIFLQKFLSNPSIESDIPLGEKDSFNFCLKEKILSTTPLSPEVKLSLDVKKNKLDYLDIRLTSRCNLKCIYCSYSEFKNEDNINRDMDRATFDNVIKNALELGVANLHFSGGEPLLNKNWEYMLSEARKYFCVSIVCNGTMVTRDIAKKFKELKLHVSISLDSINDEINKKNRFCDATTVIKAINLLLEEGIEPDIVCTVTAHNYPHVIELIENFIDKNVRIGISNLNCSGRAKNLADHLVITEEQHKDLSQRVNDYLTLTKKDKNVVMVDNVKLAMVDYKYRSIVDQLESSYESFLANSLKSNKSAIFNCQAGNFSLSINPNGDIAPCSMCKDYTLGNINNGSLKDLWENSEAIKFFNYIRKIPTESLPFCNGCKYSAVCNGGCRANAYNATGSFLAPNPSCLFVRNGSFDLSKTKTTKMDCNSAI